MRPPPRYEQGLYWLWTVQVGAAIMLYIGLYVISYTKEKVTIEKHLAAEEAGAGKKDLNRI